MSGKVYLKLLMAMSEREIIEEPRKDATIDAILEDFIDLAIRKAMAKTGATEQRIIERLKAIADAW